MGAENDFQSRLMRCLVQRRVVQNITLEHIAAAMGVSKDYVADLEKGSAVILTVNTFYLYCRAIDIEPWIALFDMEGAEVAQHDVDRN